VVSPLVLPVISETPISGCDGKRID
jgi:hypothetical protein